MNTKLLLGTLAILTLALGCSKSDSTEADAKKMAAIINEAGTIAEKHAGDCDKTASALEMHFFTTNKKAVMAYGDHVNELKAAALRAKKPGDISHSVVTRTEHLRNAMETAEAAESKIRSVGLKCSKSKKYTAFMAMLSSML